jgi:hypothetical protein
VISAGSHVRVLFIGKPWPSKNSYPRPPGEMPIAASAAGAAWHSRSHRWCA